MRKNKRSQTIVKLLDVEGNQCTTHRETVYASVDFFPGSFREIRL